jgi:stage II sporulation protein D
MKKIICYILFVIMIIIVLPFFIVKSCSTETEELPPIKQQEGMKIQVFLNKENKIEEMYLEDYIKGVVAAEMPASFGIEALKAQTIAARTYALGRIEKVYVPKEDTHSGAHVCTDFGHCQAWISKEDAIANWGRAQGRNNWRKIEIAVYETENIIITYNSKIINPVYHSNSGGRTENSEEVWEGIGEPYLKSVVSRGEESSLSYKTITEISFKDFCTILKKQYPDIEVDDKDPLSCIEILSYTTGGRVNMLKIGNIELKGTEFRKIFSLKSANFKMEGSKKDIIKVTNFGNGHGVGMSQWGANYLSKYGANCEEIIKYYYTGVELQKIDFFSSE